MASGPAPRGNRAAVGKNPRVSSSGAPLPHGEVLGPALAAQLLDRQGPERGELREKGLLHGGGGLFPVGVCTARWFSDNLVDDAEAHQVLGRQLQRGGR